MDKMFVMKYYVQLMYYNLLELNTLKNILHLKVQAVSRRTLVIHYLDKNISEDIPMNKKKLALVRYRIDKIDNQIFQLIIK